MSKRLLFIFLLMTLLSACAPMNTHFSCNETAGDRCLSIEEVNAMTESMPQPSNHSRRLWLAPEVGKNDVDDTTK